jgi:membrane fusion protein (multidrug efflux system)
LVILDDRDYRIKLDQAVAAQSAAQKTAAAAGAAINEAQSNFAVQKANIEQAQVKLWKAQQDFDRYKNLYDDHAITKAQLDEVTADRDAAQAALDAAKSQVPVIHTRVNVSRVQTVASTSQIDTRKADVDYAKLQLSYTVITAPASGIVSKRNIQVGQLVQAGTPLFSVVHDDVYITANFKETQMRDIALNQKVDIRVDAFDKQVIPGTIESFSGATGAKFSLLPPDNATGNFVKVVQRIPVRIHIDTDTATLRKLRPGMSVDVIVHTK